MRILLIGSGGREHALAWKLTQSPRCEQLFIAPGNAGTAKHGTNVQLNVAIHSEVVEFCRREKIDMVVIGPEIPLVAGLADDLHHHLPKIRVVGPGKLGAQLEGSKAFSKSFMEEFDIPTAAYKTFTTGQLEDASAFMQTLEAPYVLKADGLAAGKGVIIAQTLEEAERELAEMLDGKFGEASRHVVIEEFLDGPEFSVFVLTDGRNYQLLPVARDYKRVGEGNTGPNTGGMGAVSPVPFADKYMMQKVRERIVEPTLKGLQIREIPYTGIIFLGLINVGDEPYVIEYNCRLGDPETEVILPRIKSDLVEHFDSLFNSKLADQLIELDSRAAATVVMASGGYPGSYEKGKIISGIDEAEDCQVFLAGVKRESEEYLTNGGRVLMVTSFGPTYMEAAEMSRRALKNISFDGGFFRADIGQD